MKKPAGLPTKLIVCPRCRGTGGHDPESWSDGFSGSEFVEMCHGDPDFHEDYFSGRYDVRCERCRGERVLKVTDSRRVPADLEVAYQRWREWKRERAQREAEYNAAVADERRMCC